MALNFDMLPTTGGFSLPHEGWHKATIAECKLGRTNDGREKLELTYNLSSGTQVRFDNIVIKTADGKDLNFGLFKLRELLIAVNVIPQGNFELSVLPMLIQGKSLDLKIKHKEVNGKTYCEVDGAGFKVTVGLLYQLPSPVWVSMLRLGAAGGSFWTFTVTGAASRPSTPALDTAQKV